MLRISYVFVTLLCGFCIPLQAQTRLIFPRVIYQQGQFTGVAIANPTTSDAQVTLTAYNPDGSLFSASGVENPHIETIAAGRQYVKVASQIFNPPASISQGAAATRLWVEATSSVEGLTGFFLEGNQAEDYVDGADLNGSGTDLIVPLIENSGSNTTEISIVNPDATAANVTVDFLRGSGSVVSTQTVEIPALGALQGPLSVLFNISYAEVLAMRVRSDRPVLVYGIIFRQSDLSTIGVAGQNTALPAATLYFPQLAQGDDWNTSLGLVNLISSQIQVRISAYQADGALFGPPIVTTNPASVLIGPGAVYRADLKTLFGFSNPLQVGWIKVETSTPALAGYVEYGAGTNRALVAAQLEPYLRSIFSHQAQGAGYFTGLAVLNTSSLAANIEVTSLTQAGVLVGKAQRVVQPGQRISQLIQEWIPPADGVVGGSVFVKSDLPTVATQLFGKVNFSALANVPPQEVTTAFDPGAALATLTVTPPLAVLETGKPRQFTALGSTGVIWKVNGVAGGNATLGTISSTGLYTAPAIAPAPNTLTLEAATGDGAQSAGASVDVVQRETLTQGLTLVTAVAYLENLQRFFVAEQQVLSTVVIGGAPRATVTNTIISEQLPSGAGSTFTQIANETVGKMVPFVDGDGTSSYVLLAGTDGGKIYRMRISDKQIVTVATGLNKPNSMTLDPVTGDLLVSEQGNNQITVVSKSQFDPTPDSIVAPRPGGGPWPSGGTRRVISVNSPQGIAVDDCSGAIYVTTTAGTLLEYLGDRVRTVASGLNGPNEILALYRDGAGCGDALTLMICESNRVVQITLETGEKEEFVGGLTNAVDQVFFPDGSPFVSGGDDALAVAEGPPGLGVSRISKIRMRRLYKRFGPIRIAGVPVFGAKLPYRDPLGDNFEPTVLTAQNSAGRFVISPVSGQEIIDLVAITGSKVAGAVVLTFYFRDIITPFAAGRRNGLAGFIDFDLGPDSGIPSHADPFNPFRTGAGLGIDAFIDLSTGLLHDVAGNKTLPVPMHFVKNTVAVRIPEVLLKLLPALMTVVVGNRSEITDVAPNARFILLDLDEVAVRSVQFTREESSGLESLAAPTMRVILSNASPDTIRVNYAATGGTATGSGGDYTLLAGTLTFKPGETFKDLPLVIVNDSVSEPDETILVTLSSPFNATLGFRAGHTYRIVDDDGTPRVAFALSSSSGAESVSPVTLVVNLSNSAAGPATVNYAVTGGTATGGGVDYTLAAGTLSFAPGETSKNIVFNVVNDTRDEPDETIVVTLSSPTANITVAGITSHTYTIVDEDPTPTVAFASASSSGGESSSPVALVVNLSNPAGTTATVNYAVTGGSAANGTDYTLAGGTLSFAPGETSKTISATIVSDLLDEPDETIAVTLSAPSANINLAGNTIHTYTIVDDDPTPTVAFSSASSSGGESVSPIALVVNLSNPASTTATISYAVTGGTALGGNDYTLAGGTLTFAPGETSKTIAATIVNDLVDESDETVVVTLSSPSANIALGGNTSHTYTIVDDDSTPSVAFASASSSGAESVTPANFVVNLSSAAGATATVNYAVTGGTATGGGNDYTLAGGTLTFAPGETSKNISATIFSNALDEPDETIVVTLSSPSANINLAGNTIHTYTIVDDDPTPTVAFSSASSSGGESVSPIALVVNLSNPASATATVNYAVTGGTATGGGSDYTLAGGTLTFAPGETSKTISATIVSDLLDESDETIIVTLSSPSANITLGGNTSHTYTIVDDDSTPTVAFASAGSSGVESITAVNFVVNLSTPAVATATVNYAVTGGTATGGGNDYTLAGGTLTFAPGETSKSISATIFSNALDEPDETIVVTLSSPSANITLGGNTTHTYTILDDDPTPAVSFALSSSSDKESTTSVSLSVLLSAASSLDVLVNYAVTGGTATNGKDYTLSSGVLTFKVGETSKLITFTVIDDKLDEDDQTVVVTLSKPGNATLGKITGHTYTILDDEISPSVNFSLSASSGGESVASPSIGVTLSALSERTITVNFARTAGTSTPGVDVTLAPGTLTFLAGDTFETIVPTVSNDGADETNETLIIGLSAPVNVNLGTNTSHTYTILDDDPIVEFNVTSSSGSEGMRSVNLAVSLSSPPISPVTVGYSVNGVTATYVTDFFIGDDSFTLTFAAGETTKNIPLRVNEDTLDEFDETFTVTLSSPTNATLGTRTNHTYTILDNDAPPTVAFALSSSSGSEGTASPTITVRLSVASGKTVTVNYARTGGTATPGTDFTLAAGTFTFSPGQTSKTIPLTVVDDFFFEGDETIIITLSAPANATLGGFMSHTYTILGGLS